jgi:uncharacterized protein (TIGR04222 family)
MDTNSSLFELLAYMAGPKFLLFYLVSILLVMVLLPLMRFFIDGSRGLAPMTVTGKFAPYEVAYLREGKKEVLATAALKLYTSGLLQQNPLRKRRLCINEEKYKNQQKYSKEKANPIEEQVLRFFEEKGSNGETLKRLTQNVGIQQKLEPQFNAFLEKAQKQKLFLTHAMHTSYRTVYRVAFLMLGGMGLFKFSWGLIHGYSIGYLFLLMVALATFYFMYPKPSRLTRRGRKYIKELSRIYESAKYDFRDKMGKGQRSTQSDYAADMLAIYGIAAVHGISDFEPLGGSLRQGSGSSFSNEGCGSCGSSGGGSCGGGSCGGGCGGCGGCG